MKFALACGAALAALSLLSTPASAAVTATTTATTAAGVSAGLASTTELQAAAPRKKAASKKPVKGKKARRAAGRK